MERYLGEMSFRTRMRIGIILVIVLITSLSVTVSIYRQGRQLVDEMNHFGEYIALNLSKNSVLGVLSEEQENLLQPLKATLADKQVFGTYVYSAEGKVIGQMQRQDYFLKDMDVAKQLAMTKSADGKVFILETQTQAGKLLRSYLAAVLIERSDDDIFSAETSKSQFGGFVRVDMNLDEFFAKKTATLRERLFLIPIYILIGIIFSILVENNISKPLRKLQSAAALIGEGDFSKKIEANSKDEIGSLANSFNNMSQRLSKTITQLNNSKEKLEKANQELHDFTYIVSHDLQEPLRKIHSFGQFLLEDCYDQLSDEGKDYVNRMQKAAIKMKDLIQDLLRLSRIGTAEVSFQPVEINEVLNSALDDLSVAIVESKAEVVIGKLPTVNGQAILLTQLFENIIGNALKYRSDDRMPRIEINCEYNNGRATFSIKDNGIGIEDRFKEKIFGIFQRLHTTEKYQGTGVGLALCKKIVQRHNGEIWVESTAGQGTTFYFTLSNNLSNNGDV